MQEDIRESRYDTPAGPGWLLTYGGFTCRAFPNPRRFDLLETGRPEDHAAAMTHDAWAYSVPDLDGRAESVYSHPAEDGARHMCRRRFLDAGLIEVPAGFDHLEPWDSAYATEAAAARAAIDRPLVGDWLHWHGARWRIVGIGWPGAEDSKVAISPGGSFFLYRDGLTSHSGGLDHPGLNLADLRPFCAPTAARFWFFKGGRQRAHNGVDVLLPVKVWHIPGQDDGDGPLPEGPAAARAALRESL